MSQLSTTWPLIPDRKADSGQIEAQRPLAESSLGTAIVASAGAFGLRGLTVSGATVVAADGSGADCALAGVARAPVIAIAVAIDNSRYPSAGMASILSDPAYPV